MKNLIPVILFAALVACNDNTRRDASQNNSDTDSPVAKAMIPRQTCYENVTGRDTMKLKVEVFPNVVTGTIVYALHEKDRNDGEFDGKMTGDTLIADYTFMSEGVRSTRQVAFLIKDNVVIEGYGPSEEKEGKMVFTDLSKLTFSGRPLRKAPCHTEEPLTTGSAGSEALFEYQWNLVELQGKAVNAQDVKQKPHLLFYPGQVSRVAGSTGCNRLSGTSELSDNNTIKFSPIAATRMACPGTTNIEQEFLDALSKTTAWKIVNKELIFFGDGNAVAKFLGSLPDTAIASQTKNTEPSEDRAYALFHQKFLAGIDIMATGNEPFWWLEIDEQKNTWFGIIGGDTVDASTPQAKPLKDAKGSNYKLQTKNGVLDVIIYDKKCVNDMSGESLPKTVKVTFNNKTYNGCGRLLAAYSK
jgi:heat shock protein HslJ/uncharacterized membrane protein